MKKRITWLKRWGRTRLKRDRLAWALWNIRRRSNAETPDEFSDGTYLVTDAGEYLVTAAGEYLTTE